MISCGDLFVQRYKTAINLQDLFLKLLLLQGIYAHMCPYFANLIIHDRCIKDYDVNIYDSLCLVKFILDCHLGGGLIMVVEVVKSAYQRGM